MSQRYNSLSMGKRCFRWPPVNFTVEEFSRRWYKRLPTHVILEIGGIFAVPVDNNPKKGSSAQTEPVANSFPAPCWRLHKNSYCSPRPGRGPMPDFIPT